MHISRKALVSALVAIWSLVVAPTTKADSITYVYNGNEMTAITGVCPAACTDTAEFTFSSPLPMSYSGSFFEVFPESWSMTDGTVVLSSSTSDFLQFNLGSTSSLGLPTAWGVFACVNSSCPASSNMSSQSDTPSTSNDTTNQQAYSSPYFAASGPDDQGAWTVAPAGAPEPSTLCLFAVSGLSILLRRSRITSRRF